MECCYGVHRLSLLRIAMVVAAAAALNCCLQMQGVKSAKSTTTPMLSWSSELSISIDAGNGSAIVKGSALLSPDHKSWAFGVVVGTNSTDGQIPFAFGIFKAVDSSNAAGVPTWEWKPVSSADIASATVSFSPGEEIVLSVRWRNGTGDNSVAWSSDTGGEAQAVALTNSGQLLLLDAQNRTIWERPSPLASSAPSAAPAPLAACPANICLLPPPPSSSPPAPPSPPGPSRSPASHTTTSLAPLWLSLVLALLFFT